MRRAYGAHHSRNRKVEVQARNIAESMQAHPGRTLAHYGIEDGSELAELVKQMLNEKQAA